MPHIVTAQELARFLKLKHDGAPMIPSEQTDPTKQDLDDLLDEVEAEFETATYNAFGHEVQTTEWHEMLYEFEPFKGRPIYLTRVGCKDIDTTKGDKVELKIANEFNDITENVDFYNMEEGKIWVRFYGIIDPRPRLRITYRYGMPKENVTHDIRLAIKKMAFINAVEGNIITNIVPLVAEVAVGMTNVIQSWRDDIDKTISRHRVYAMGR